MLLGELQFCPICPNHGRGMNTSLHHKQKFAEVIMLNLSYLQGCEKEDQPVKKRGF